MKKTRGKLKEVKSAELSAVTGGVVPVVLGNSAFDLGGGASSQAVSELGLTTVEQQGHQ